VDPAFQDVTVGRIMNNAEVLARRLMTRALAGDEKAQALVIERVEGKAGRAADPKQPDTALDEQLDAAGLDAINDLLK
jgi:hypothetical protein